MLKRVDDLLETDEFEDDEQLQIIQAVLLWVDSAWVNDNAITEYFPEEE